MTNYRHIVFKDIDDKNHSKLLQTSPATVSRSNSPKKWSPEIASVEKQKRKIEREQAYIGNLSQEKKPIFLIQEKKVFKNLKTKEQPDSEANSQFHKVFSRSAVIKSLAVDLEKASENVKRNTVVSGNHPENDIYSLQAIFQIKGIEFLPQGFLELDPLLFLDEFEFDSAHNLQLFFEEQRKTKVKRRKQYTEKDKFKKREVVIMLIDKYKDNLENFFENFYVLNKRKMNGDEMKSLADVLHSDLKTISEFQELYLKTKKLENVKKLTEFLADEKTRVERAKSLPLGLKKHFIKITANFLAKNPSINIARRAEIESMRQKLQGELFKELLETDREVYSIFEAPIPENKNPNSVYYDTEINRILEGVGNQDKLQELLKNQINKVQIFHKKSAKEQKSEKDSQEKPKMVDQQTETRDSLIFNKSANIKNIEQILGTKQSAIRSNKQAENKTSKLLGKITEKMREKFSEKSELGRNKELKKSETQCFDVISIYPNKIVEIYSYSEDEDLTRKRTQNNLLKLKDPNNKEFDFAENEDLKLIEVQKNKIKPIVKKEETTMTPIFQENKNRITIVARTNNNRLLVVQKLAPVLIGNNYFFQTIEDFSNENGDRIVTVTTKKDLYEVIDKQTINIDKLGNFHHNILILPHKNARKAVLVVRNENSVQLCSVSIEVNFKQQSNIIVRAIMDKTGMRKGTLIANRLTQTFDHHLEPFIVGVDYFQNLIQIRLDKNNKPKINCQTFNEIGEIISDCSIQPEFISDGFMNSIVNDFLLTENLRRTIIKISNSRSEIVLQQCFNFRIDDYLNTNEYQSAMAILESENGREKVFFTQKSKVKPQKLKSTEFVKSNVLGNKYTLHLTKDEIIGEKRTVQITAKNIDEEILAEKSFVVPENELISDEIFHRIEQKVEKGIKFALSENLTIPVKVSLENFSIEIENDTTDEHGERTITISTNQDKSENISKKKTFKSVSNQTVLDELILEVETDLKKEKFEKIKKESVLNDKLVFSNNQPLSSQGEFKTDRFESEKKDGKNKYYLDMYNEMNSKYGEKEEVKTQSKESEKNEFAGIIKDQTIGLHENEDVPKKFSQKAKTKISQNQTSKTSELKTQKLSSQTIDLEIVTAPPKNYTDVRIKPPYNPKNRKFVHFYDEFGEIKIFDEQKVKVSNPKTSKTKSITKPVEFNDRILQIELADEYDQNENKTISNPKNFQKVRNSEKEIYDSFDEHESSDPVNYLSEENREIIQKPEQMKKYLGNYLKSIENGDSLKNQSESKNKESLQKIEEQAMGIFKVRESLNKRDSGANLMHEFVEFCKEILPGDNNYKESMLFVSLFYFFLDRRQIIENPS